MIRWRNELKEINKRGDPVAGRIRREGAGRPKKEEAHPEIMGELQKILQERTADSPTDKAVKGHG